MPRQLTPDTSIDSLRKEAKRWLKALRAGDAAARGRLLRTAPQAADRPGLRDVQFALAREYGMDGWRALKDAAEQRQRRHGTRDLALRALMQAAEQGDTVRAAELLHSHPDLINERGTLEGRAGLRTALHFGIEHEPLIRLLLERGADPNIRDEGDNACPLHLAAERGDLAIVKLLVEHGANPGVRDSRHGATPAGWAISAGKQEAFDRLMLAEIDVFDAIDFDRAERISPILKKDPAALRRPFGEYLPQGAQPPTGCPDTATTPLAWATARHKPDAARVLMAHGAELASGGHLARTDSERLAAFLRMACLDWAVGGADRKRQTHAAARLIERHPELTRANIYAAVACGEVEEVDRLVRARPAEANERGGPRDWPPLLYLCTARFPAAGPWSENAVAIARMLLDRGADPNAYYHGGDPSIHYTALASVAGRGEEQASVHPRARDLAELLLEHGAEPYDQQILYNVFAGHASFGHLDEDDFVWLLEMIYQESTRRGRRDDWSDPWWRMLDMGGYGGGAWYLLHRALDGNYLRIAEWALARGASPNPPPATDPRTPEGTLYQQAIRRGRYEFAELLARYGAERTIPSLEVQDEFTAACFRLDKERARALSTENPARLVDTQLLSDAAEQDRADVVELLLGLGMSPDLANESNVRALHIAAYNGAPRVASLLIARGAEIDPRDRDHEATPIYWAHFGQRDHLVELLTPHTRDVWTLVPRGRVDRLRAVLEADRSLAHSRYGGGTPLFFLPDDERAAVEIVRLFLAHGADPSIRRADGATAGDIARARGLFEAAQLLACD